MRVRSSLLALSLLGAAGAASAQYRDPLPPPAERYQEESVGYDFARVIDVQPVYDEVSYAEPRRTCWNEPVTYVEQPRYTSYRRHSDTPEIVGGIIGGLIGNQFGSGSGRAAATVAGVALGASVARDSERRRGYYAYDSYGPSYTRTVSERRCEVREDYRNERQLIGYDVTYDYNGTIGHTFSERQPGTEIRVRVAVEPADY